MARDIFPTLGIPTIQAQQDLTQARADYFTAIAEFNKAQYDLNKAVGGTPEGSVSGQH